MPNRIIRNYCDSERVDHLSASAEAFFVRLITTVDDFARFSADPRLLKAALYPLRTDSVRLEAIQGWLDECVRADVVDVYTVGGKSYLEILRFDNIPRAQKSKFPPKGAPADWKEKQMKRRRRATAPETETESATEGETEIPQTPVGGSGGGLPASLPRQDTPAALDDLPASIATRLNAGIKGGRSRITPAQVEAMIRALPPDQRPAREGLLSLAAAYLEDQAASSKPARDLGRSFRAFVTRRLTPASSPGRPSSHHPSSPPDGWSGVNPLQNSYQGT